MIDRHTHESHTSFGAYAAVAALALIGLVACKPPPPPPAEIPELPEPEPIVSDTQTSAARAVSDLGISEAVARQLVFDGLTPGYAIVVQTTDGIVELTGTVDNILAQARATRVAKAVKGVRSVSNRIEVEAEAVPDAELAADVESALLFDAATESYEVDVSAADGTITLTGKVDSYAESELTEQVAASVRGVAAIENHLMIEYAQDRSDTELTREIERLLARDVLVDERRIRVAVRDGRVELSGVVGSAIERDLAHQRAWTAGVHEVVLDDLRVDWRADDPDLRETHLELVSVEEIRDAIEDAALHDPRVLGFEIRPVVEGSTVTLLGVVDNLEAKRAAEQLARSTIGVGLVDNQLEVARPSDRSDSQIAAAITGRLLTNVHTERREIEVDVRDGVVTLSGTVDSFIEKAEATSVASRARGVVLVDNQLRVSQPTIGFYFDPHLYPYEPYVEYWSTPTPTAAVKTDAQIEVAIEDELFWSPFVDEREVNVLVEDGEAVLTGTVESWRARADATRNAYEGGAMAVENLLYVEP